MTSPINTLATPCARKLVYLDAQTGDRCPVCGFELDAPGEAAQHLGALAHVACAESGPASMRGGA